MLSHVSNLLSKNRPVAAVLGALLSSVGWEELSLSRLGAAEPSKEGPVKLLLAGQQFSEPEELARDPGLEHIQTVFEFLSKENKKNPANSQHPENRVADEAARVSRYIARLREQPTPESIKSAVKAIRDEFLELKNDCVFDRRNVLVLANSQVLQEVFVDSSGYDVNPTLIAELTKARGSDQIFAAKGFQELVKSRASDLTIFQKRGSHAEIAGCRDAFLSQIERAELGKNELTVYVEGFGKKGGKFQLWGYPHKVPDGCMLSPEQLANALSSRKDLDRLTVNVVLDFCYSGSFADPLVNYLVKSTKPMNVRLICGNETGQPSPDTLDPTGRPDFLKLLAGNGKENEDRFDIIRERLIKDRTRNPKIVVVKRKSGEEAKVIQVE